MEEEEEEGRRGENRRKGEEVASGGRRGGDIGDGVFGVADWDQLEARAFMDLKRAVAGVLRRQELAFKMSAVYTGFLPWTVYKKGHGSCYKCICKLCGRSRLLAVD